METVYGNTDSLPLFFWVCTALIGLLAASAIQHRKEAWAVPSLMVLGTLFAWYLGDILYSGMGDIGSRFPLRIIHRALAQVALFAVAYQVMAWEFGRWATPRAQGDAQGPDPGEDMLKDPATQDRVSTVLGFVAACWLALFLFGQFHGGWHVVASLFPPLAGYRHDMWQRTRMGGATAFLMSAAHYTHLFLCALFGVLLTVSRRRRVQVLAGLMMLLTWPYFLFAHGRNTVLAIGVPTALGYLRFFKHRFMTKLVVLACAFLAVSIWFKFVVATRHTGVTEALVAVIEGQASSDFMQSQRHLGLDMFKELCYVNEFIETGRYEVNWGQRYFAELVNFVPRSLWPGKPTIGLDYSKARGAVVRGWGDQAISMTISTGMIGQGVVNFGTILGPVAAAFLMSIWTVVLARLWTQRRSILRAGLYLVGLGLTFNAGRDITLLVFFPFIFGYLLVFFYERHHAHDWGATWSRDSA